MAIAFEQIQPDFTQVRDFVLNDVHRVVSQEIGGNYAAVALIILAYDALADLHNGAKKQHQLFGERLPAQWQPVAKSLFAALRNGLVHHWQAKRIVFEGGAIQLYISWRDHPHLEFADGCLYLNVPHMAADLRDAFDDYEKELRADPVLRDDLRRRSHEPVQVVYDNHEVEAWRALMFSGAP